MTSAADTSFWAGKKVLVTGHTGFKGSWLCLWLQSLGAEPVGFSRGLPSGPAMFDVARVAEGMASVEGDLRDADSVTAAFSAHRPEIVIHMGAQPLVRRSFEKPAETYEVNVMGTVNVLEAVRRTDSVRSVVVVTSDKCYENRGLDRGYTEEDPLGGSDPYSASKAAAELVTASYRRSFFGADAPGGATLASARAGNVIGGGDWGTDRLIPDVIRATAEGEPVVIRNPAATRPWQHALNPLSGYLLLCQRLWESGEFAEAWNFGPAAEDSRSVESILDYLDSKRDGGVPWARDAGEQPPEAQRLEIDSTKARDRLGWRPRWSLETAFDSIVAWDRSFREGEDMRERTLADIAAFERSDPL